MSSIDGEADVVAGEEPEYEEKLDEQPKSILMAMIRQLKTGMDLSRVTLPTFILEPRSFLEKCSDFMAHGRLIQDIATTSDPLERFLTVTRWYLCGWHFKPPGVKKPYNPILGEVFHCKWDYGDGGTTYYLAEQVSHHPPISAFHFVNRKAGWILNAAINPKSKFLGNSAASIMDGQASLHILALGETYTFNFPSYYVRGLLIGVMRMEIAGDVQISCKETGFQWTASFTNRGYFKGENNSVSGKVTRIGSKDTICKIDGRWDRVIKITDKKTGASNVFLDVEAEKQKSFMPLNVDPEDKQKYYESRRVWSQVTRGLKTQNLDFATEHKTKLEDGQRAGKKERDERGQAWQTKLFEKVVPNDPLSWRCKICKFTAYNPNDPEEEKFGAQLKALADSGELAVGTELMATLKGSSS
ncbi:hypothetical protein GUITHDRAFT_163527 [Guillardia theta CCMP2712]|uniref:Oxysterol-binding protein n=1 Tax=Guillardia theta (strain CCMP2712) TaxID=905079 RepID=L1J9B9_GUITC|nr:hypothetical protein GUITHDRAFT_163527 [Guillardia theta CCMP2712]EKX44699.1 hypothetical protein GUITHDRAFT_163527 [Guillardia theta CCMP2712]|eukprot:XP_005831679.1 hypothetical protein GUITHDRAFT_163527 [Guillardia theta CCMP2712]